MDSTMLASTAKLATVSLVSKNEKVIERVRRDQEHKRKAVLGIDFGQMKTRTLAGQGSARRSG